MSIPFVARLKNAFAKSRFANPDSAARHVSLIAGGTVIAQAVGILAIPVVSRIYSPADYGIMAVYASVIAILGQLSGFRYHLAIPLPKDERYAKALVVLSLGLQIAFVSLLTLLLFVAGEFLLTKLSMPELIPYRALIPLGLLATGTYLVLTQWALREKLFSTIARTKISQSLSGTFAKIGLGLLGVRPLGLLIGTIVAQGGGITTLLRSLLKKKGVPRPVRVDMRRVALRYWKFPLYGTLASLLDTTGSRLVPILLVACYDPQIAGLFAMAQNLLSLPASFVGHAMGQVFMQRASAARYTANIQALTFYAYTSLLHIGYFPILLISLFAPFLFNIILGEHWVEAGKYAQILGPWIAFTFAYSPITLLYIILDRQDVFLFLESIQLALIISSFLIGYYMKSPLLSIALISITGLCAYIIRATELLSSCGISWRKTLLTTAKITTQNSALALLPQFAYMLNINMLFIFFITTLVLVVYIFQLIQFFKAKSHETR
jgi:O-antigen/teichoic acid export membrane protein